MAVQTLGKNQLLNRSACICDLLFRTRKVQTAVSKHLEILPKIRRSGNRGRVWVKTASSAAIIVFLVYSLMWCDAPVKCDGLLCDMACSVMALWLNN